jgi:hypothetical protein
MNHRGQATPYRQARDAAGPAITPEGYLAAHVDLLGLSVTQASCRQPGQWIPLEGNPAIRSELVYQERVCQAYPHREYPEAADVLQDLRRLGYMDETVYLRSGMLNIFNGLIGLTFSCDRSHCTPRPQFLEKGIGFWLGKSASPMACAMADAHQRSGSLMMQAVVSEPR